MIPKFHQTCRAVKKGFDKQMNHTNTFSQRILVLFCELAVKIESKNVLNMLNTPCLTLLVVLLCVWKG